MEKQMQETPKPKTGTWTLISPDGRKIESDSPLKCARIEQRERVPADVGLARIFAQEDTVTDEQRAIEFAEYMAKSAEAFLRAVDALQIAQNTSEQQNNFAIYDEEVETAQERLTDFWRGLESSIYEFRKRAERCAPSAEQRKDDMSHDNFHPPDGMNTEEAAEGRADEREELVKERDISIAMLAAWCVALDENGTGLDDWD